MAKKNSKSVRVDPDFAENLMRAMETRFKKGLCNRKELNMVEATRLVIKSRGNFMTLEEIRSKPKRSKR